MRDGTNTMMVKQGISTREVTNNTAQVSAIIDTLGYEWVQADIVIGNVADADATFTLLIEDGNNGALSDAAAVADAYLISQTEGVAPEVAGSFAFNADNQVRRIEVQSPKRYVRGTITPANNTGSAFLSLTWRLGSPQQALVVQGPT